MSERESERERESHSVPMSESNLASIFAREEDDNGARLEGRAKLDGLGLARGSGGLSAQVVCLGLETNGFRKEQ